MSFQVMLCFSLQTAGPPDGHSCQELTENDEPSFMYYVNDGLYGSFNSLMYDHAKVEAKVVVVSSELWHKIPLTGYSNSLQPTLTNCTSLILNNFSLLPRILLFVMKGIDKIWNLTLGEHLFVHLIFILLISWAEKKFSSLFFFSFFIFSILFHFTFQENPLMFTSSIWGPTCDGLDCIMEECRLPELKIGDWVYFPDMGAYTMAAGSTFNGMPRPECFYYCHVSIWWVVGGMVFNKLLESASRTYFFPIPLIFFFLHVFSSQQEALWVNTIADETQLIWE